MYNQVNTQSAPAEPMRMAHTVESLQKAAARLSVLTDKAHAVVGGIVGNWPVEADSPPQGAGSDLASQLRNIDDHVHRKITQIENAVEMLQSRVLAPQATQGLAGAGSSAKY